MQQHLQRLDGVAKAEVSLLDGRVTVFPKPGAALDPSRILKAAYDSGVSVVEMEMTASGSLQDSGQGLVFRPTSQQSFAVNPNALTEKFKPLGSSGRDVSIRARLYQAPPGGAKSKDPPKGLKPAKDLKLEVLEID